MIKDLQEACGLPVKFDTETCELILGEGLNDPSYCVRKLHDLNRDHSLQEGKGTELHVQMLIVRYLLDHLPAGPR